ncbi:hypothetical protein GCM10011428_39350 [Streptomyces violaceus]
MAEAAGARLADPDVEARLARLDGLLEGLESPRVRPHHPLRNRGGRHPDRGLRRGTGPRHGPRVTGPLAENLAGDELLGHLLVLHDIHPRAAPSAGRPRGRAAAARRPGAGGGDVEWAGVGQVARVRLTAGGGCGSGCGGGGGGGGTSEVTDAVSAAVLAVAPELTAVEPLPSTPPPRSYR